MKIVFLLIATLLILMICVPILFTIISISYISINTVIYDLFIGTVTGLIASCITYVFANIIPRVKLEKEKQRQYVETVKRHGYGLFQVALGTGT